MFANVYNRRQKIHASSSDRNNLSISRTDLHLSCQFSGPFFSGFFRIAV